MSDNNPSAADPFGQIADEFVEAFRQGKRPSVEEFARRYPAHSPDPPRPGERLPETVLARAGGRRAPAGIEWVGRRLAQLVVDEREQLRRGVRGAGLDGAQHLRDVGHDDIVANPGFAVTSSSVTW